MSQPSTPSHHTTMYPPSSMGYPQFIAPFGDESGRRAAVRVFFGDKEARHIPEAQLDFGEHLARWSILQNYATPSILARSDFRPSVVDLDPQVDDLKREGSSLELPLHFLLTALSGAEFVSQDAEVTPFKGKVGSIWSSALPDDPDVSDEGLVAQFERFVDHCTIDVSGRRNLFFMPSVYRELIESRAAELVDELDMLTHSFDDTLAHMRPIFFHGEGQATNHVLFFEPRTASLNVLCEVFSSCWIEAIERPASTRSGPLSGRHERELSPGIILGERYEITSRIGSGGFAIVYEATDTKVSRQVAIKVIDLERHIEERSRQSYIKRFEREARLAVSVRHPCVVEVLDLGVTDEDVPYIVMERLEGWDLDSQSHRHGPMKPKRLIPLFIQALEGLGCAHEKDIVHKDLKPSNIFLRNPGKRHEQLCILDFGVARRINTATARLTQTDSAFGTPHYMAPEYSTSQIATPALDVYQMGLILVEMLMGEPVVSHPEPVAAMFQHVRGDLSIPQALLESPLGEALRCALSTNHLHRYQDGFEFADALRQLTDLSLIPVLDRGAARISLNVTSLSDPDSEVRETPVMGANLLTTDRYRSSQNVAITRHELSSQPHSHLEPERVPEISPFASTLPFDDLPEQLAGFRSDNEPFVGLSSSPGDGDRSYAPPPFIKRAEKQALTEEPGEPEVVNEEGSEIVDYSSKRPYVLLISLLLLALLVTTVALLRNKRELQAMVNTPAVTTDVVTDYDRKLGELRERAGQLDAMLQRGEIEELIEEVARMDALDVRLTPDEVERVKVLVKRARQERVNRAILDRALQLVTDRQHERALDHLDTIAPRSVFWNHPDTLRLLDSVKTALLPQVQRERDNGNPERARRLVEKLIMHDPQNTELTYLLMDVINDITSQPPAMLPLDKDMDGAFGSEIKVDMSADMAFERDAPDQSP
jgi:serine/threonine protein kinase